VWGLAAVEVVARDDVRAAGLIHVDGTIGRIVTALDTCTRTGGLNKLHIVFVPKAGASLWVTLASGTTAGIVLTTGIVGVQTAEVARPDTTGELGKALSVLALSTLESNVGPEVRR